MNQNEINKTSSDRIRSKENKLQSAGATQQSQTRSQDNDNGSSSNVRVEENTVPSSDNQSEEQRRLNRQVSKVRNPKPGEEKSLETDELPVSSKIAGRES